MWKTYGKSLAMLLATLVMAGIVAFREIAASGVNASEVVVVVIALFSTATVWAAANISGFEKAKTLVAAIGLVLNLLIGFIVDGLTTDEVMLLVVHLLGALGVAGAPAPKQIVTRTVQSS